jgi:Ca2+-binding RTX toxin-like protein
LEYHGTAGDDVLDQSKLGLADGSVIYGGKGNDTITVGIGTAVGQEGNDRIIGTSPWSTLCFWSPAGVVVNLATGIARDCGRKVKM